VMNLSVFGTRTDTHTQAKTYTSSCCRLCKHYIQCCKILQTNIVFTI